METNREKEVTVLNRLIEYNNDRVEGYQKAAENAEEADLKSLFNKYSSQSVQFGSALQQRVTQIGGEPATGTTNSQALVEKLYDRAFGRKPSIEEASVAKGLVGEPVKKEGVEDLLWGMAMLPEFQLIY